MRMGFLEEQLEKMAGFEDQSNGLIEENNAKFESIKDELRGLAQLQDAPSSSNGKKLMEFNEERPKPKKVRQVWVRRAWVPRGALDSVKDDQETSFTLEGKRFKLVKTCGFLWKVKKPPRLGVWS